ncbi:MAG: universal stress protein [Vicingaceae bacterium]
MKKILIPTDFSRASKTALKVATHIARQRKNISLRLSHVYHVPRVASLPSDDFGYDVRKQKKLVIDIHEKLNKLAKEKFVKGLKIETQVVPHIEVKDLIQHKDNKDADLIICGIHGDEWKESMEAGQVEEIIRHADCPVLCVNETIREPLRFDNIIFASDFSPEVEKNFPALKKVMDVLGGRIHLVKVITSHHFEKTLFVEKRMKEFAKKFYLTNYTIKAINEDTIEQGIHLYAYHMKADVIAMETHGLSGFMHYLKGSITEAVAHHSELSVLTIKIPTTK